ncbi:hypothetical protein AB751O23_AC_00070 [Chlamydiales bacterium SCGC AB-751-O23]|nr:hypothetical protein AB751O23_AC_00070 [Chlamydiales bacterium SCGC AB-751-O23]
MNTLWPKNIFYLISQKPFKFLGIFFLLSIALWLVAFSFLSLATEPALHFPKDKDLVLSLEGTVGVQSNTLSENYQSEEFLLKARVRGKKREEHGPAVYRFSWEVLEIQDINKESLFVFKLLPGSKARYKCSPKLKLKEREALFNFFAVDYENPNFSEDQSHLRKPFHLTLGKRGSVGPLKLYPAFRRSILRWTESKLVQPIVLELIDDSQTIVSLLPNTKRKKWTSKGEFLVPLKWKHERLQDKDGHLLIKTKSYEDTHLKKWAQRPFLQDLTLKKNDWELEWQLNKKKRTIEKFSLSSDIAIENQVLDRKVLANYKVSLKTSLDWQNPQDIIPEKQDI